MRTIVASGLVCVVVAPMAFADKAPLSADQLQQEAELIVVGRVESLNIDVEPSRYEPGHGNFDWTIDVGIKVEAVEKGTWTNDRIDVRCFRAKSRASMRAFLSPSGHRPSPDRGAPVRAYLRRSDAGWEVVLPNGFSSPDANADLSDAQQLAFADGRYTYLLPIEVWWLVAFVAGLVWLWMIRRRGGVRMDNAG